MSGTIRNYRTDDGGELGEHLARLCDEAEPRARLKAPELPPRCNSCAFRAGRHLANGSPATLMDALKCVIEGREFLCHAPQREGSPCSGWAMLLLAGEAGKIRAAPWDFFGGKDDER